MRLGSLHQTVLLQAHDERKIKYGHANIYCSICHLLLFYILTPYLSSQHFLWVLIYIEHFLWEL